ncbi:MAG: rRNA pseudouridine synthase [Chloroflexi bacterium]|nr:MAG: rRNA pseudouridine synthase [Chloroflexota bacterium]
MERLQRVLASRGVASRRKAEELITSGRVRVDGKVVRELGVQVDPERQKIEVDGKLLPIYRHRYILLNKPAGYITTTSDERDRRTVMDLVQVSEPVVPVGRLDRPTEGLLLLTNDGDVAYRLTHPRFEIDKEYEALLDGHPPAAVLERVRRGIVIDGERASPSSVRPIKNLDEGTVVRIVLHEGRNRIVRRMFEEVGYPVLKLVRTRIGPLQLGSIPRGKWRDITDGELEQLREALHLGEEDVATARRQDRGRSSRPPGDHAAERRPDDWRGGRRQPRSSDSRERTAAHGGRGPRPEVQRDQPRRSGQRQDRPQPQERRPEGPAQWRDDSLPRQRGPQRTESQPRQSGRGHSDRGRKDAPRTEPAVTQGSHQGRRNEGAPRRPGDERRSSSDQRPRSGTRPHVRPAAPADIEPTQLKPPVEQRHAPRPEPADSAPREVAQKPRGGARKVRGSAHTIVRTRDRRNDAPGAP